MKKFVSALALLCPLAFADLTADQKLADFNHLAAMYAKHYAPYEWKRDTGKFDLMDIQPWLERIAATRSDIEFYDVCVEYVASLNDGHVNLTLPADFSAYLGFRVDLFDNVPLVYAVNTQMLPASRYPISVGDEVVSIDGVPAEDLIRKLAKYNIAANDRSTARLAADSFTIRWQALDPTAASVPDESTVVLRGSNGQLKTLTVPWDKAGSPLTHVGPVPSPKSGVVRNASGAQAASLLREGDEPYLLLLRSLANRRSAPRRPMRVQGWASVTPVYRMPSNFRQRLGRSVLDNFYSGVYEADGQRIGFIRIPDFDPPSVSAALNQFAGEIQFFQGNVDGLVVDVTRNPGGDSCYAEALLSYLIPTRFRTVTDEIRATNTLVNWASQTVDEAESQGAPSSLLRQYRAFLAELRKANQTTRGMTEPMRICSLTPDAFVEPARDRQGRSLAFNRPLMLLTDDMSASAADMFAAIFQDAWRGPVFGWRTMGLGGAVLALDMVTPYSEAAARITWTHGYRPVRVSAPGYPSTHALENVGVHPDIQFDPMTKENLMSGYAPFVQAFTNAMVDHIRASR